MENVLCKKVASSKYVVKIDPAPDMEADYVRARRLVVGRGEKITEDSYKKVMVGSTVYKVYKNDALKGTIYVNDGVLSCVLMHSDMFAKIVLMDYLFTLQDRYKMYPHGNKPTGMLGVAEKSDIINFTQGRKPYIEVSKKYVYKRMPTEHMAKYLKDC